MIDSIKAFDTISSRIIDKFNAFDTISSRMIDNINAFDKVSLTRRGGQMHTTLLDVPFLSLQYLLQTCSR